MDDLSFFVTHGAAVWQAVVAASVVCGAAFASLFVHRAMRARASRVREALGKPSPEANVHDAGKRVTLTGTLRVVHDELEGPAPTEGGAAVTVVPQGLEQAEEPTPKARSASVRGAKLAIDAAGTLVLLDGPVQVLAGSRETERCVAKTQGQVLLWDFAGPLGTLPARAFSIRSANVGDKVIVRGVLRHEPEPLDGGGYRSGRATYALEIDREDPDAPVIPLAYASSPRPLVRSPGRMVLRALPLPLAVLGLFALVGEAGVRMTSTSAWTAAAATPFRRSDALGLLRGSISLRTGATAPAIARAVALDQVRGKCTDASDDTFEHHQLEESARIASGCKDAPREARAFVAMADFPRAADAFERARKVDPKRLPSLSEATAYLAVGKSALAAETLRALGRTWEDGPNARDRFECAALAVEAHGDHPEVTSNLQDRVTKSGGTPGCGALATDLLHGNDRANFGTRHAYYWGSATITDWRMVTQLLLIEEAGAKGTSRADLNAHASGATLVFDPRAQLYTLAPGLAEEIARRLAADDDPRAQLLLAQLLAHLVHLDSYLGEIDAAHARIRDARAALEKAKLAYTDKQLNTTDPDGEGSSWRYGYGYEYTSDPRRFASWRARQALPMLDELEYGLHARAGITAPPTATLPYEIDHVIDAKTSNDATELEWVAKRDDREVNRKLWNFVLDQDGPGLVARLEERGIDGRGVVDFLGKRPKLAPSLARWVRYGFPAACTTCGVYPLANQIVSRREAAAVAGATDIVDETTAAARRLRTLLLRRDIAIPLAAISELSPP